MTETKAISAYDQVWVIELWEGAGFDNVFLNKADAELEAADLNKRVKGAKAKVISLADSMFNIRQEAIDSIERDF